MKKPRIEIDGTELMVTIKKESPGKGTCPLNGSNADFWGSVTAGIENKKWISQEFPKLY